MNSSSKRARSCPTVRPMASRAFLVRVTPVAPWSDQQEVLFVFEDLLGSGADAVEERLEFLLVPHRFREQLADGNPVDLLALPPPDLDPQVVNHLAQLGSSHQQHLPQGTIREPHIVGYRDAPEPGLKLLARPLTDLIEEPCSLVADLVDGMLEQLPSLLPCCLTLGFDGLDRTAQLGEPAGIRAGAKDFASHSERISSRLGQVLTVGAQHQPRPAEHFEPFVVDVLLEDSRGQDPVLQIRPSAVQRLEQVLVVLGSHSHKDLTRLGDRFWELEPEARERGRERLDVLAVRVEVLASEGREILGGEARPLADQVMMQKFRDTCPHVDVEFLAGAEGRRAEVPDPAEDPLKPGIAAAAEPTPAMDDPDEAGANGRGSQ